jgi:Mg2+-importing ATPase
MVVTLMVPFTPFGEMFGFRQLPMAFLLLIGSIVIMYMITAEMAKAVFYQKAKC